MTSLRDTAGPIGEPIGELDGELYYRVATVWRRGLNGIWDEVGTEADWSASLAARLIAAQRELAELRAQLAAREPVPVTVPVPVPPARPPTPREDAEQMGEAIESFARAAGAAAPADVPAAAAFARTDLPRCPHCGKVFGNKAGLGGHIYKVHGAGRLDPEAPFRCVDCKSDAHARDLHDPDRCVRCAQKVAA